MFYKDDVVIVAMGDYDYFGCVVLYIATAAVATGWK